MKLHSDIGSGGFYEPVLLASRGFNYFNMVEANDDLNILNVRKLKMK